ncbi:hypothetical protein DC522_28710 [Microvirga sp. KLBC 81]|uniref:O-antigen ligase family protein n=1 Tax=Microvirga sp. KLBC 81 TaxID=1862707 RepID=UPI000D51E80F|nr:O-antigen ligase family protein [Microvirga sp. KLBC 81]PVE21063.1 hypothetical protein DC522_28710 [Microvirga sp. KLBC 81]
MSEVLRLKAGEGSPEPSIRGWLIAVSLVLFAAVAVSLVILSGNSEMALMGAAGAAGAIVAAPFFLKRPFLGLLALVFFAQLNALALVVFSALSIDSPIKFLAVLTLGAALYQYRLRFINRSLTNEPYIARFVIVLTGALMISVLFARSTHMATDEVRRFLAVVLIVFLVSGLTTDKKRLELIVLAIVVSTLVSALFVLYDWGAGGATFSSQLSDQRSSWQDTVRSSGGSLEGATMAATMLLCGTSLAICLAARASRWRLYTVPTALIGTFAIALTLTRSATVTLVLLLTWLAWRMRRQKGIVFMVVGVIVTGTIMLPLLPDAFWDKISTLTETQRDSTLLRRLSYHIIGLDLLLKYPLTGIGAGNFPIFYGDFEYRFIPGRYDLRPLHNQYLQYPVESGLLAGMAYVGMLFSSFLSFRYTSIHARSEELRVLSEGLMFSFVSIIVQMFYLSSKFNKYLWVYIGLAIAVRALLNDEERGSAPNGSRD